ncbi:MAG: hypothetical protein K6D55_06875 [Prevotella sp.]|nr:hypothetical protein [Prevotella sp.]
MGQKGNQLPQAFTEQTKKLMGEERFARYLSAFDEEPPVSIRLNPGKVKSEELAGANDYCVSGAASKESLLTHQSSLITSEVPWCRGGFYLPQRPAFTFDPLLHAGCYYVQEAASMFLDEVLRQHLPSRPLTMLDLCAAPGGKSTLALAALPEGSVLFANEPMRQRASILLENISKWGAEHCHVTSNFPADYRKAKMLFDVILCDVPCSGEGMFRKDEQTIGEWSPQQVERCQQLQRQIVTDVWQCLSPGGLLIYSTCTLNTRENEENVMWLLQQCGDATPLAVDTQADWHISGSLLPACTAPVYRFIPGITQSEGLFMCAFRKAGEPRGKRAVAAPPSLHVLTPPFTLSNAAEATAELTYAQAISYLRGEALVLPPSVPRGMIIVTFMGHALGPVKNIGARANNLYPKEWRIKSTHFPQDYEAILRHT